MKQRHLDYMSVIGDHFFSVIYGDILMIHFPLNVGKKVIFLGQIGPLLEKGGKTEIWNGFMLVNNNIIGIHHRNSQTVHLVSFAQPNHFRHALSGS